MIVQIGVFIISIIPATALFFWCRDALRKGQPVEEAYKKLCNNAITRGLLCSAPVILESFLFALLEAFAPGLRDLPPVPKRAFHDFFVLAFSEELVKYLMLKGLMKKNPDYPYAWLEVIVFMVSVGIGFELIESLVYAFSTNVGQILVRGVTAMHAGFGFIMGNFLGKGRKTGDKKYRILGFVLPWLIHGLFDFSLSEEADTLGFVFTFIAVTLAALSFVLLIYMVFFMRKARENEKYTEPF